jgi:hypothetical protein
VELEVDDAVLAKVRAAEDASEDEELQYEESELQTEAEADPPGGPGHDPDETRAKAAEPPGLVRIGNLLGIPLLYQGNGTEPRPTTFRLLPQFKPVLEATVRQTRERAPAEFGELRSIVSLGMYTDKAGAHGRGLANDWDRLRFANLDIAPREFDHEPSKPLAKRQRYWAFAAICRSNSAFVLHGFYDSDHRNHIHQDTVGGMAFDSRSEAMVKLCQAVCNEIFGAQPRLAVDGSFGTKSQQALTRAQNKLGITTPVTSDVAALRKFLRAAGRLGFVLSMRS